MVDPSTAVSLGLACLGGVIWAVRLEGRVNAHEKTDAVIHHNVAAGITELKQTTIRTEEKIDRLVEKFIPPPRIQ